MITDIIQLGVETVGRPLVQLVADNETRIWQEGSTRLEYVALPLGRSLSCSLRGFNCGLPLDAALASAMQPYPTLIPRTVTLSVLMGTPAAARA